MVRFLMLLLCGLHCLLVHSLFNCNLLRLLPHGLLVHSLFNCNLLRLLPHGLLIYSLVNCNMLGLLPHGLLVHLLGFFQLLDRDTHVVSLGLVSQLDEFSFLRLSFIFTRLDQGLVTEGTFDTIFRRMGH